MKEEGVIPDVLEQRGPSEKNKGDCVESLHKDEMYPHPKSGSDVETDVTTHAPRGYFKKFYSHNKTFWGIRADSWEDQKMA